MAHTPTARLDGSHISSALRHTGTEGNNEKLTEPRSQKSETSLNSALQRYFRKEGETRLLQEQLGDLEFDTQQEKNHSRDSDEIPWTHSDQIGLSEKLRQAQEELNLLRLEAEQRDLDIEGARYRDRDPIDGPLSQVHQAYNELPVRDWLERVDGQSPPPGMPHESPLNHPSPQPQAFRTAMAAPMGVPVMPNYPPAYLPQDPGAYYSGRFHHTGPQPSFWPPIPIQEQQPSQSPYQGQAAPAQEPRHRAHGRAAEFDGQQRNRSVGASSLRSSQWDSPGSTAVGSSEQITSLSNGFKHRRTLIKTDGKTESKYKGERRGIDCSSNN